MNKKQKRVLWGGVTIIVLMGLFPPWKADLEKGLIDYRQYGFLFHPPLSHEYLDMSRLIVQWFIVGVFTATWIVTTNGWREKKRYRTPSNWDTT